MNGKLKWLVLFVVSISLLGCGGGGGGGGVVATPPATATLTGTVTDTTLAPVAGATVRVNNGAAFTTNAAGRYTISGLPVNTSLSLSYTGPNAEFFPAGASVTLAGGKTTVLDLFLARAVEQTVLAAEVATGKVIDSGIFIDAANQATFSLAANELTSGGGAYAGDAKVYLTPVDVAKPGHGLASFQASLNAFFPALAVDAAILETYGSAGLTINDTTDSALGLVAVPTSTLTIPVPVSLQVAAPASVDLWRFDSATSSWLHTAGETATLDGGGASYTGTVSSPGLWRAALQRTEAAGLLTEITGTLRYNTGAAVGGATIYLNGTDHGFQSVTTTMRHRRLRPGGQDRWRLRP